MSDQIKHECGIALIRLLKPLSYYHEKYGTWKYGLNKLYLLMEKQHNRGQDGAGICCVKSDLKPGNPYISRHRSVEQNPIKDIFDKVNKPLKKAKRQDIDINDPEWAEKHFPFALNNTTLRSFSPCQPFKTLFISSIMAMFRTFTGGLLRVIVPRPSANKVSICL